MGVRLALAAVLAMGGCMLQVGEEPVLGIEFEADIRPTSKVGCPTTLVAGGSRSVTVLEDSVVIDGRVYSANVGDPENGSARVEFTAQDLWTVGSKNVAVSIWFRGTAWSDGLDFVGTMSSAAPELAGCMVDVQLLARAPIDDGWGD